MIIPPGRDDFTVTGLCPGECSEKVNRSLVDAWRNRQIKWFGLSVICIHFSFSFFHQRVSLCLETFYILILKVFHQLCCDEATACDSYSLPILGHGLVVRQYRQNDKCSVLEELQPIDENRRYDFNFQQVTHLPTEIKVLPVSIFCNDYSGIQPSLYYCKLTGRYHWIAMLLLDNFHS